MSYLSKEGKYQSKFDSFLRLIPERGSLGHNTLDLFRIFYRIYKRYYYSNNFPKSTELDELRKAASHHHNWLTNATGSKFNEVLVGKTSRENLNAFMDAILQIMDHEMNQFTGYPEKDWEIIATNLFESTLESNQEKRTLAMMRFERCKKFYHDRDVHTGN